MGGGEVLIDGWGINFLGGVLFIGKFGMLKESNIFR